MSSILEILYIEPFVFDTNDIFVSVLSILLGISVWFITLVLVGFCLGLMYTHLNFIRMPIIKEKGIVIDKYKSPGYNHFNIINVNGSLIPINNQIPKSYTLKIKINDKVDSIDISKRGYKNISIGDGVDCEYRKGRFNSDILIDKIMY